MRCRRWLVQYGTHGIRSGPAVRPVARLPARSQTVLSHQHTSGDPLNLTSSRVVPGPLPGLGSDACQVEQHPHARLRTLETLWP